MTLNRNQLYFKVNLLNISISTGFMCYPVQFIADLRLFIEKVCFIPSNRFTFILKFILNKKSQVHHPVSLIMDLFLKR